MASKEKSVSKNKKKQENISNVEIEKEKTQENIGLDNKKVEIVGEEEKKEKSDKEQKEEKIDKNNEKTKSEKREEIIKSKNNKWCSAFLTLVLIIFLTVFSTIFALLNIENSNLAKGVKVKGIDVSGLTIEEATEKVEKVLNIELMQSLEFNYKEKYEVTLESVQIEFEYDIKKAISDAYKIGRDGNIIQNNYELLYTAFFGKNVTADYTYNKELLNNFIDDTESKLPGVVTPVTYYIEGDELIINKGIDGLGIDKEKFKKDILDNMYKKNAEEILKNKNNEKILMPVILKKAEPIDIEKIYQEIYTEPKDAYYELEPFNIYPEVNGIDLEISVEEAKKQIESEEKEEYKFKLKITPPEKTIKSFGIEAFPNLVSSFSTRYDARNLNRSKNLEIAAGKINGLVLMPGEIFSFNKIVGKRTVEEGYRDAKIYQDGAVVDGLAGGICQISSTLYNAVLLANLEIVERRNHSFTTSYVPAGRDATVVYGITDFQFKNSRNFPIKIEATVNKGIATFKIHSVSLEENEYEIKITPIITESIPYATEQVIDPTLVPGQQVITQNGQPGYKVITYKEVIQNGNIISKDIISTDVYRPMRTIVKIGP